MTKETPILHAIMLRLSAAGARVFRQNTGQGWVGQIVRQTPTEITLRNYRPLHAGLCVGSSDIIGWKTVTVTPEMVGRNHGIFMAVEVKTSSGRLSTAQGHFLAAVNQAGGVGIVARSEDEAAALLDSSLMRD